MSSVEAHPPSADAEREAEGPRWRERARRAREAGWRRAGWLAAELLVVFVGVYAAFILDAYRETREEDRRERRIYETLHRDVSTAAPQLRAFRQATDSSHRAFMEAYERGEMPRVRPIVVSAEVDEGTWNAMLQGGGFDVLDVAFVQRMENLYASGRYLSLASNRAANLSAQFIWPRLEEGNEAFYDPATRRLRPAYSWYPGMTREMADRAAQLASRNDSLLAELEAKIGERK